MLVSSETNPTARTEKEYVHQGISRNGGSGFKHYLPQWDVDTWGLKGCPEIPAEVQTTH